MVDFNCGPALKTVLRPLDHWSILRDKKLQVINMGFMTCNIAPTDRQIVLCLPSVLWIISQWVGSIIFPLPNSHLHCKSISTHVWMVLNHEALKYYRLLIPYFPSLILPFHFSSPSLIEKEEGGCWLGDCFPTITLAAWASLRYIYYKSPATEADAWLHSTWIWHVAGYWKAKLWPPPECFPISCVHV